MKFIEKRPFVSVESICLEGQMFMIFHDEGVNGLDYDETSSSDKM